MPGAQTLVDAPLPDDDDEGFGNDAEAGSPFATLAAAMASPRPGAASTTASPSPFDMHGGAPPVRASTEPAEILDDDFEIPRQPGALANAITLVTGSRRNMAIAAGGVGLLVIVCALAFCGGSKKPGQTAANTGTATKTPSVAPVEPAVAIAQVTPDAPLATEPTHVEPPATGPTAEELAAAARDPDNPDDTKAGTVAPTGATGTTGATGATGKTTGKTTGSAGATPASKKTIGGKQVVLESDKEAKEAKPIASAPKADQGAIQKARAAYAAGNQRLFAGDAGGAIKYYRQALGSYPGYVAGYRGLGLAYAQQGDKPKALQALKQYLASVPGANDAALIRKRVAALQAK